MFELTGKKTVLLEFWNAERIAVDDAGYCLAVGKQFDCLHKCFE